MNACQHGALRAARAAGCLSSGDLVELSQARRAALPEGRRGRGSNLLGLGSSEVGQRRGWVVRAGGGEGAGDGASQSRAYEQLMEDLEEKYKERTGAYKEDKVRPMSLEEAQGLLALDRPDLSIPVTEPIEWKMERRPAPTTARFGEVDAEAMQEGLGQPSSFHSNAGRRRSVEERCNLQVRRKVSQNELAAMGVPAWPVYAWSQMVDLGLSYDRVAEACYIEQGRVRVRLPLAAEDDYCELSAGDFVRFPKYSSFLWEVVDGPVVRRYKFVIDLPPPPDAAEVLRLRLHEKKMEEVQIRASVKYQKKPVKSLEKQARIAETEIMKDLADLKEDIASQS